MPIRIRLTLWYTFLLGAILVTFSILLYWVLGYSLHSQINGNLQDRAQQVGAGIVAQAVIRQSGNVVGIEVPELNVFSSPAIFIQVIQADGTLVTATDNLGKQRFPADQEMLQANRDGHSLFKTITIDKTPIRIYSAPIRLGPRVVGAVQVGQSLKEVEDTLQQVFFFLIGGTLAGLILAGLVGAFLAWTTLRPIERINQAAMQIVSAQDLKQRLPISNTNDEIDRLIVTINDMLERLDNFFQAQVRLSADVSHELRTPLTVIRGNVDLLRRGATNDPNELNEALSIIDGELDRMSRIVADLLLLSQADAGLSLRMQPVELDTIILDVYRQARVTANGVNIQLGHEDQAVVQGDADRLKQLLLNLVTNALKHTPPGGYVTLSLFREPEWIRITVADTGRGIAPTALPHIFERFYRAEDNNQKGTGLGLSIAQWIAQAHGGQITVTSEVGKGSIFTLWLPRSAADRTESRPMKLSQA
ncbi:MAG: HAMP domain-containing sensor histidine kinase [Anaerolineae bacterium]